MTIVGMVSVEKQEKDSVLEVTTIPMEQSSLRWRLADPQQRVLQPAHLEQIKPLDAPSARRLREMTQPWYREQPFTQGFFADVEQTPTCGQGGETDSRRVRKWLYQRGVPFKHSVFLSWSETEAAVTNWKMFVKYWDDLWYPISDDLAVFDESLSWALFLWHEEEAFFASRPITLPDVPRKRPLRLQRSKPQAVYCRGMAMAKKPEFDLWLEFEHTVPTDDDDATDDFANIQVRLPDGRKYALNVWTFRFLERARHPWPYEDTSGSPAEYVIAPDLFVERLDRPTLERVIGELLAGGIMSSQWLCPDDLDSP